MSNDKQQKILQMAKDICRVKHICTDVCEPISACDALKYAERAVEAGYVKQKEGEWVAKSPMIRSPLARNYYCSACKYEPIEIKSYCPQCGARMKGGAE